MLCHIEIIGHLGDVCRGGNFIQPCFSRQENNNISAINVTGIKSQSHEFYLPTKNGLKLTDTWIWYQGRYWFKRLRIYKHFPLSQIKSRECTDRLEFNLTRVPVSTR